MFTARATRTERTPRHALVRARADDFRDTRGEPAGSHAKEGRAMPIATPEVYARDARPGQGAARSPTRRSTSPRRQTLNAAHRGLRRGGERRHHPGLHRRRRVPVRPDGQGHGHRLGRARRVRPRGRQEVPGQHRAAHRPLPEGQARRLRPPAARDLRRAGGAAARSRCSSRTCGTARPCRWTRTCAIAAGAARRSAPAPRSSSRSRSASSAARRTASTARSTRSSTPRAEDALATVEALGLGEKGRYMPPLTFGNVHGVYKPGNVKLRPEILEGDPGRRRRQVRQGQAVRPGLPRRLRLAAEEIREALSTTAWSR